MTHPNIFDLGFYEQTAMDKWTMELTSSSVVRTIKIRVSKRSEIKAVDPLTEVVEERGHNATCRDVGRYA